MTRKKQAILQKYLSYKGVRKIESKLSKKKKERILKRRMYVKISLQIIFDIIKRRQYPKISNHKKIKEDF